MKTSLILLFLVIIFFPSSIFAEEKNESITTEKTGYNLYLHRVKFICNKKPYKSNEIIIKLDKYYPKLITSEEKEKLISTEKKQIEKYEKIGWKEKEIEELNKKISEKIKWLTDKYSIEKIKKKHRSNMNAIYKCWLLTTQKKALLLIKNDIINISSPIRKKIEWKIDSNITKLDKLSKSIWCSESRSKSSIQKLILLKQATFQTCNYVSYLEYLIEYNKDIQNNLDPTKSKTNPNELINIENDKINKLYEEIDHTYKVFPIAFHAYSDYENNITAHFLLELLKDEYILFREKLHKVINPINQVVYKISNAMKK